ncbi:MAG: helix-hairpin-helix domain-containing protein [Bacillota bacterium]|jgi:DNA polymerase (family 10)
MTVHKYEIAHILRTIGALLQIKGEGTFKVRSYEKAAEIIERGDYDLELLAREGRLLEVPGIGRNLEPKIKEIILTGRSTFLESVAREVPMGLLDLIRVPGIGPKTAKALYDSLGVCDLDTLEEAIEGHLIQKVPGLGARREELMAQGLKEIRKYAGRVTLGLALPVARHLANMFRASGIPGTLVGEVRRSLETVSSIEVLLKVANCERLPGEVQRRKIGPLGSEKVWTGSWDERKKAFVFSTNLGIPLKIYTARDQEFGLKTLLLTGPCGFTNWIKGLALDKGYDFSDDGPEKGKQEISAVTETDVYEKLDIGFIPPEVRHRAKFWEAALGKYPIRLAELSDVKGDLHIHTTWSDGLGSIEQMVLKALELGYSYIAITDHITKIKVINGLNSDKIRAQLAEIDKVSRKYPQIRIFSGAEVDILRDGSLACPDDLLSKLDIVVASIHQDIGGSDGSGLDRLMKAARNPNVDIIGHPTGRLIGRRPGNPGDYERLFKLAASNGTVLEVNSSPDRLDLSEELALKAVSLGARLAVSTDAHSLSGMDDMVFGLASPVRRAGLGPGAIINTLSIEDWFPLKKG